jgi:hypothetical protein
MPRKSACARYKATEHDCLSGDADARYSSVSMRKIDPITGGELRLVERYLAQLALFDPGGAVDDSD